MTPELLARLECLEAQAREAGPHVDEMRCQLIDCQRRLQTIEQVLREVFTAQEPWTQEVDLRLRALEGYFPGMAALASEVTAPECHHSARRRPAGGQEGIR